MKRTLVALLATAAFAAPAFAQTGDCASQAAEYEAAIEASAMSAADKTSAKGQVSAAAQLGGQQCIDRLAELDAQGVTEGRASSSNAMPTTGGSGTPTSPDSPPAATQSGAGGAAPGANPSAAPDAASPGASSQ